MVEVEWNNDLVTKLMKEYEKRPLLWDTKHDMYRVRTAKYEAWSELAAIFGCDITDVRKKLNSVFASFRREKAKIRNGAGSTWFLYSHMQFLPSHIDNLEASKSSRGARKSSEEEDNAGVDISYFNDTEYLEDNDEIYENVFQPSEIIIKSEPRTFSPTQKKQKSIIIKKKALGPLKKPTKISSHMDSKILETLKLLKRSDLMKKKDECDTFGEYIATSLRKHDDRTQAMIKQAINNILFEQEMKKYNSKSHQYIVLETDENPLILGDESDK